MADDLPEVSIVVATWNCESTLQRCIDSIAKQTFSGWELVIADGASTDATVEIIKHNRQCIAWWQSEPDNGIYDAWNKALARVRGRWICFLGADDYFWAHDSLEQLVAGIPKNDAPRVIYGSINRVSPSGETIDTIGAPWSTLKKRWATGMVLPHPGLLHHKSLFSEQGVFDPEFQISGDYELLLRELPKHGALFVPGVVVAGVQEGGISTNRSYAARSLREARIAREKRGLGNGAVVEHWLVLRHWTKHYILTIGGRRLGGSVVSVFRWLARKGAR